MLSGSTMAGLLAPGSVGPEPERQRGRVSEPCRDSDRPQAGPKGGACRAEHRRIIGACFDSRSTSSPSVRGSLEMARPGRRPVGAGGTLATATHVH